jgi:hypothetical protein
MKKLVALVVLLSLIGIHYAQGENEIYKKGLEEGYAEGQIEGSRQSQSTWMMAGCGSGFLLGCIGGGGIWVASLLMEGEMPIYVPEGDAQYRRGFIEGYKNTTKSRRSSSALIGGLVGTAVSAGLILLIYAYSD